MFQSTINKINIHPAVYMMEQWRQFMDGIDRIVGFYYSEHSCSPEGLDWSNKAGHGQIVPFIVSDDVSSEIKSILRKKVIFNG